MTDRTPLISVIIPAYREAGRIGKTIEAVAAYFKNRPYSFELIVVDDGSPDDTMRVVASYCPKVKALRLISYSPNRGKGFAVKTGMLAAKGDWRLYMDADNAIDIGHFDKFISEAEKGYDVVVGSVCLAGSRKQYEYQLYRKVLSHVGHFLMRAVNGDGLSDTLRAFKFFSADAAEKVFPRQTVERFGYDLELMVLARKGGLKIKELPVAWLNPKGDNVRLGSYIEVLKDLFKVRWNALIGKYD